MDYLKDGDTPELVPDCQHEVDRLDESQADDGRATVAAPEARKVVRLAIVPVHQTGIRPESQKSAERIMAQSRYKKVFLKDI